MGKRAKSLKYQIELLEKRGMTVPDAARASEMLLEIGWYRLSLYWFPFETRYPDALCATHRFVEGTTFEDALRLYAFDFNLRHALLMPLERIETAFRTFLIYSTSNRYPESPYWFADARIVTKRHADSFDRQIYQPLLKNNRDIQMHHRRFPRDRFAPAWKTLEYLPFGAICTLYDNLLDSNLRHNIAARFGFSSPEAFSKHINAVKALRNLCAHGGILYSYRPGKLTNRLQDNLSGVIDITFNILHKISPRIAERLSNDIAALVQALKPYHLARATLKQIAGI